jgi:hypothetical protein
LEGKERPLLGQNEKKKGKRKKGGKTDTEGSFDGRGDRVDVAVTIVDTEGMPSVGLKAGEDILSERDISGSVDTDLVVVIENDKSTFFFFPSETESREKGRREGGEDTYQDRGDQRNWQPQR